MIVYKIYPIQLDNMSAETKYRSFKCKNCGREKLVPSYRFPNTCSVKCGLEYRWYAHRLKNDGKRSRRRPKQEEEIFINTNHLETLIVEDGESQYL